MTREPEHPPSAVVTREDIGPDGIGIVVRLARKDLRETRFALTCR